MDKNSKKPNPESVETVRMAQEQTQPTSDSSTEPQAVKRHPILLGFFALALIGWLTLLGFIAYVGI